MLFILLFCAFLSSFSMDSQAAIDLNEDFEEIQQFITEIHLGNKESEDIIYVYVSPSCLHCAKFIVEDLEKFLEEYGDNKYVVIRFLPASAKDIFIIKLISNEANSEDLFFLIFKNYMKRMLATINKISPTDEQQELFKGSKQDPEMIKFQVGAHEFGFSEDKVLKAYPDMKDSPEKRMMAKYSKLVEQLSNILNSKEINLPLIVKEDKVYRKLSDLKD